jgi:hypothetical protein
MEITSSRNVHFGNITCIESMADLISTRFSHQYFRSLVNDKIGGDFFLYLPSAKGYATVTMNGIRGNPTIQFDPSIGAKPNILIDLDPSDVIPHDTKYFIKASVNLQEIKLTRDLPYEICDSIHEPGNPINPVFAFYDNSYWIHDPRFVRCVRFLVNCYLSLYSYS